MNKPQWPHVEVLHALHNGRNGWRDSIQYTILRQPSANRTVSCFRLFYLSTLIADSCPSVARPIIYTYVIN